MIRVAGSCVFILIWIGSVCEGVMTGVVPRGLGVCMPVTEYYHFVDAEDGESARYVAGH